MIKGSEDRRASSLSPSPPQADAIIVAAGSSQRMGGVDKIFAPLRGKPLIASTVEAFQQCPSIVRLILVLGERNLKQGEHLLEEQGWDKVVICPGGLRRQDSVAEGLKRLEACQWVVIHDGARPCVDPALILKGIEAAQDTGAAIAAVPVKDTIKVVDAEGIIRETPERTTLWAAQTPQVFRFDIIREAYSQAKGEVTDDAALVERLGYRVRVYPGSYENIKVTTPEDLMLAEAILKERDARGRRL